MKFREALRDSLKIWGIEVCLEGSSHPSFHRWLSTYFPSWPFAEEFSSISVPQCELRKGTWRHLRLNGNQEEPYFPAEEGSDSFRDVIVAGFIPIGSSICGDPFVINTQSKNPLEVGFISHGDLWNPDVKNGTDFYMKAPSDLPEYLLDLYNVEGFPSDFYGLADSEEWRDSSNPIVQRIEERREALLKRLGI